MARMMQPEPAPERAARPRCERQPLPERAQQAMARALFFLVSSVSSIVPVAAASRPLAATAAAGPVATVTYRLPATSRRGTPIVGESSSAAAMYSWNNNASNPDCCGGVIIEGCSQYPNGPTCWGSPPNATVVNGSYGWIALGPKAARTSDCPAIPADGIGSQLGADTPLYPVSLKEALTKDGSDFCVLACNMSEVERTGVDPCNKGTIAANAPLPAWLLPPVQKLGSPEQMPSPVTMSCFSGGMGWMKDPTMGMCGYNATVRSPLTGEFCPTFSAPPAGCPTLALDPRTMPCCGGTARCETEAGSARPMCCQCKSK